MHTSAQPSSQSPENIRRTTPPAPRRAAGATPPTTGRRARAKAEKRARILRSARSLISEKGYAQMSMSEVAARADVAAGTVFQYAATKAELLMMVTESLWAEHITTVVATPLAPGRQSPAAVVERIVELLSPFFEMSLHWPETTAWIAREILFGEELPHRAEVLALVEKLEEHIARVLGGCLDEVSPRHVAHLEVGARMIVTSSLAELNRARQGRTEERTLTDRIRGAATLVAAGVSH
ncbi:TetR/AcrR family transcriptional regulator [Kocuria sp.]|nr:TetR/AcrR family transcriptional regulator [Kocuria sp.]MDN5631496.1 TetR/AcrR family transcriptional regulator [Kocuria sp.]